VWVLQILTVHVFNAKLVPYALVFELYTAVKICY